MSSAIQQLEETAGYDEVLFSVMFVGRRPVGLLPFKQIPSVQLHESLPDKAGVAGECSCAQELDYYSKSFI